MEEIKDLLWKSTFIFNKKIFVIVMNDSNPKLIKPYTNQAVMVSNLNFYGPFMVLR